KLILPTSDSELCNFRPFRLDNLTSLAVSLSLAIMNSFLGLDLPDQVSYCDKNSHVTSINLRNAGLSGTIALELHRLRKLRILILSENNFSGPIPPQLSEIGSLWKLKLDHNNLTGSIPGELSHLSNLRIFDLSYNALSGPINDTIFRTCRRLRFVSFAQNRLSGSLPGNLRKCTKLTGFDFSSNLLNGNITIDITKLNDLTYINLQSNSLSGPFPQALSKLTALNYINMGNNHLSGTLPEELGKLDYLKQLSVNNNLFSGEVPADIVSLPSLQHLDLSCNSFTGRLHLNGSGCASLRGLNLAENMFEGDMPLGLSNCSQLVFLNLAKNEFNGSLLPDIGRLALLKFFDANGNQFVGEIPANITGLVSISALVLGNNKIQGRIPREIGNLRALEILDLSGMKIEGAIPSELCNCTALQKLDLSSNKMNGSIPAELSNLSDLREIDLENNSFTGTIPSALGNLTGLAIFNVSYNHLSGTIPRDRSLAQFGSSSFIGNSGLCGEPLSITCSEARSPPTQPTSSPAAGNPTTSPSPNTVTAARRRPFLTGTAISAIAITGALVVGALIIAFLSVRVWRKQKKRAELVSVKENIDDFSSQASAGKLVLFNGVSSSLYNECIKEGAGALVDKKRIVGAGSIGTVYEANTSDGTTIAVKKLRTLERMRDAEEFEVDMRSLENVRHPNLVMVQGYYLSTTLKLILSEFVPNGTLSDRLHDLNPAVISLTWLQRYTIGLGIARGLVRLHCNHSVPIMHFNLTSANVLLDERLEAKISDYGLRKFLPIQNKYISSRIFHETLGYVAPELACGSLRVSEKCDVYSFGVVLLEIVTGRKPCEEIDGATVLVGDYVRYKLEQGNVWECVDPRLKDYDGFEVVNVIKLALICTSQEPSTRPTMAEAARTLEESHGSRSVPQDQQECPDSNSWSVQF
uniref:Protein kinase domain-containing protein n=1 Tax=Physcomitrium patens TaxID=3218 RepID=A0A7I4BWZ7_PHYPA